MDVSLNTGDLVHSKTLGPGKVIGEFHFSSLLSVVFPPDPPHTTIRAYTRGGREVYYDLVRLKDGGERIRIRDVAVEPDLTI